MSNTASEAAISAFLSSYSLEVTAKDIDGLAASLDRLIPPSTVFVPYLPDETIEQRVAAAKSLREFGMIPVPHVSARRVKSAEDLRYFLEALTKFADADRVFIIAGDPAEAAGPYSDTLSILKTGFLQEFGIKRVGIAGHPDGHPKVPEPVLWSALEEKSQFLKELGLPFEIVTQFSFDAARVLDWIADVRQRGIDAPIALGVPGPASVKTLLRFAARCGVTASSKAVAKYGLSLTMLLGKAGPERFLSELVAGLSPERTGDVRAHIYPFGGFADTAAWLEQKIGHPAAAPRVANGHN